MANKALGVGAGIEQTRPANSLAESAAKIKAMYEAHGQTGRKYLEQCREIGKELNAAKDACVSEQKPWHDWLKRTGIAIRTAQNYMRIAEKWSELVAHRECTTYTGVAEALIILKELDEKPKPASTSANGTTSQESQQETEEEPEREAGDDTAHEQAAAEEPPIVDAEGEPVPPKAVIAFEKAKDQTDLCRDFDKLLHQAEELHKQPGGRCIRIESVKQQLRDAKGNIWANRPTHVCPYCHGKKDDCKPCNGEGWVPKHVWHQAPGNNEKAKRS